MAYETRKPNIFNPKFSEQESNNDNLNLVADIGKKLIDERVASLGLVDILSLKFLKPYFQVDNQYVYEKIKLVFFPFLYKHGDILGNIDEKSGESGYISREKIYYPDMYIPLMAFISYLLLTGLEFGLEAEKKFHPDLLVYKASTNLTVIVFHAITFKLIFYIFFNLSIPFLNFLCYISYKFVNLIIFLWIWIIFKNIQVYYFSFGVFTIINIMFINILLKHLLLKQGESELPSSQMLIIRISSLLEIISIFFLIQ